MREKACVQLLEDIDDPKVASVSDIILTLNTIQTTCAEAFGGDLNEDGQDDFDFDDQVEKSI